jgi:hypothetical protein
LRKQEAKEELERLNRRRAEREVETRLREEEELRMQRMAESAQMTEWLAKDGDFQLEQERRRASIRIKEKRAKAVDFLALNLKYANPLEGDEGEDDTGLEIDLDEPYNIFDVSEKYLFGIAFNTDVYRISLASKLKSYMKISNATCRWNNLKLTSTSGR